ncbi:MAG: SDR family NAD(P)-dependent oxidoreductase, partial [Chloroflexi bacterium]|nr:SDR family NAD(P)-dependent oxidoreductase [Chloroflexota bacterium]
MKLEGKVAAITGAGSGMGKAIALAYAREGAKVVAADLNLEAAQKVADEIAAGGEAIAVQTDVRDQAQAQAMVDAAVASFGGLDILVNNAGVGKIIPFLETTNEDWDFMFDVNCKGMLWCSQAAARQMIEQGRGGKIVNLASQAG